MQLLDKLRAYATLRWRRNHTDLLRWIVRRPALMVAMGTYEGAIIASNRAPDRYKTLADIKAAALVGCPF